MKRKLVSCLQNRMVYHNNHFPRAKLARHLRCAALELLQPAGLAHARNHSLEHKAER